MEPPYLLHYLLPTAGRTTVSISPVKTCSNDSNSSTKISSESNAGIIFRITIVLIIGTLSIWANHEASKGFAITIINDEADSVAGKRFALFYQSNDKAKRIVLSTSKFVEGILYSPSDNEIYRKKVSHVTLRFGGRNLTEAAVEVEFTSKSDEFTIHLSYLLFTDPRRNYDDEVYLAIQRGMAQVWLRNGDGHVPKVVGDAIVESIISLAGYGEKIIELLLPTDCFQNGDGTVTVLGRCFSLYERQKPGFLRRLNQGNMKTQNLSPSSNSSSSKYIFGELGRFKVSVDSQ